MIRHQTLLQQFRNRFLRSYLPALREQHQATSKKQQTVIKEKDIVLVHDDKPRKDWKMAVVESLIRSRDGEIRAAEIRTAKGKTNRPIAKLHPLQISEPVDPVFRPAAEDPPDPASIISRLSRKSADRARAAVKKIFEEEAHV